MLPVYTFSYKDKQLGPLSLTLYTIHPYRSTHQQHQQHQQPCYPGLQKAHDQLCQNGKLLFS